MIKRHQISHATRYALATCAAVTAAGYVSTASAASANTPAQLGKVTVTGTRIKRTNIETAQPITRISRQQIQKTGYTNIGQLLGRLSFSGAFANDSGRFSNGAHTVDLRNLGANRNLVLVNGKRWMQGLGGATNLNTIPTSIIDHIEILQDGASAVYGSDAIAGVVNIITVKNFNGAEAHAYYGIRNANGHWDGQTKQYDFTIGGGNDRGNVVFNATYREKNSIYRRTRKLTRTPVAGEPGYVGGNSGTLTGRFRLFGPAVGGRTFGQGTCATYDPDNPAQALCDFTLRNAPAQPSLQNFRTWKSTDAYNQARALHLTEPLKDVTTYVQGHYDLFNNVTFTANAAYVRDEATLGAAREAIQVGANVPGTRAANGERFGVAATNPYNPFGVDLVADPTAPCLAAGSCIGIARVLRKMEEVSPRVSDYNNDYFHIFAGFNGYINLFNREIDWDVGFAQNRLQHALLKTGAYNNARLKTALGPGSQCTSPCVPINIFGGSVRGDGGTISPAQLNYITYERHDVSQSNLRDWTANISSDVYDLPAGPLGLAIGYERVDNYGYNHPDAVVIQGNDSDGNGAALNGRVVRDAEYAELNIPLLADLPGAQSLSLDIANRWTQFKRSGGVTGQNTESFIHNSSGRLNIRYQPVKDLLVRASWSQGFRSPNINELFGGLSYSYANFTDPCAPGPNGGYTGGTLPPNCPNGTLDAQAGKKLNSVSGSNPNLEPEKSISRTLGFVYSPSQVPGLDINADYFKIELNNAVGSVGRQNIANSCFYNSSFCELVTTSGNQVINIRNVSTNVGTLLTDGIDVGIHYKFPSTPIGDFDARINGTFLKTFDQTKVNLATQTGFATSHLAGVGVHPKRRFNGYLDWDYGNWSAQYSVEYISAVVDQCTIAVKGYCSYPNRRTNFQGAPDQFSLGRNHLGATVYHNVHVAYTVPSINTTFGIGVNNLFNKKPPITGGGLIDTSIYRLPSRLLYGSVRVRF